MTPRQHKLNETPCKRATPPTCFCLPQVAKSEDLVSKNRVPVELARPGNNTRTQQGNPSDQATKKGTCLEHIEKGHMSRTQPTKENNSDQEKMDDYRCKARMEQPKQKWETITAKKR